MIPKTESASCYWTEEMARAYGVCRQLIGDDLIAARMAFKEAYQDELMQARTNKTPIKWRASFGTDLSGRYDAVSQAKAAGYITQAEAKNKMLLLGGDDYPDPKPLLEKYASGQEIVVRTKRKTAI